MEKEKIFFPVVGISVNKTDLVQMPKIESTSINNCTVTMPLTNVVDVCGDMDLLMKAGIDVLGQNIDEIIQEVSDEDM